MQADDLLDQKDLTQTVPFGKYRGKPIEALRGDPSYVEWLMGQDWFREKYQTVYHLVVNNFGEPKETPQQNRITTRFLDQGFCRKLFLALMDGKPVDIPKLIKKRLDAVTPVLKEEQEEFARRKAYYDKYQHGSEPNPRRLTSLEKSVEVLTKSKPTYHFHAQYEYHGWTVHVSLSLGYDMLFDEEDYYDTTLLRRTALVKIRPSLGDDFPTVLRQMKAGINNEVYANHGVLLINEFTGDGASLEDVTKIFKSEGFRVLTLGEIEGKEIKT